MCVFVKRGTFLIMENMGDTRLKALGYLLPLKIVEYDSCCSIIEYNLAHIKKKIRLL